MGLILLGTADANSAKEMHTYARETQHEKVILGFGYSVLDSYTHGRQDGRYQPMHAISVNTPPSFPGIAGQLASDYKNKGWSQTR